MNKNPSKWLNRYKMKMRKNPTKEEYLFNAALKKAKIKFRHQSLCYSEDFQCIVDFLIKCDGYHIAIEIDGNYHFTQSQIKKDNFRTQWLEEKRGYDMIRFTNEEVNNNITDCLKRLAVYYIRKVKNSSSNNFKAFQTILN